MRRLDQPRVAAWLALAALLGSALARLSIGDLSSVALVSLAAVVACMVGLGELLARAIGPLPSWVPPVSARLVSGVAAWAVAQVVLTLVLPAAITFWLATLAGGVGLGLGVWSARHRFVRPSKPGAGASWVAEFDALGVVLLFSAATTFTDWIVTLPRNTSLIRHYDMVYHLAAIKELVYRGIPANNTPYIAGMAKEAYHPTFDTFAAQLISNTGVPVDSAYFRFVIPLVAVAFLAAIGVICAATARRFEASPLGISVMLVPFALWAYKPQELASVGALGRNAAMFYMNNPPAALALPVIATSVFAVALAENDPGARAARRLALAGVFATALVAAKANAALAFLPAFVVVVAVGWLLKRWRFRDALWAAAACAATLPAALALIAGGGQPIGIEWGAFVGYLQGVVGNVPTSPLLQRLAMTLAGGGPLADVAYLAAYLLVDVAIFAVPAALVWLAVWLVSLKRGEHAVESGPGGGEGDPRDGADGAARAAAGPSAVTLGLLGAFAVVAFAISLLVVQPGVGVVGAWNVAIHVVANLLWVSAAFLVAGVSTLAFRRGEPTSLVLALLSAVLAIACVYGTVGFVTTYGEWWHRANRQFFTLATRLEQSTPRDAIVVQHYDTDQVMWVSGFGGRLVPIERADMTRDRYPDEIARREQLILDLYAATTPQKAREIAGLLGADYAMVDTREPVGPGQAGPIVDRVGYWALVDLRGSAEDSATP